MIDFFIERVRGIWVAILTVASVAYGWVILDVAPMWKHLVADQNGTELQATWFYGAAHVAKVFGGFDAALRADALNFYAVDVVNAVLFGASVAALIGFGIRRLDASRTFLRWVVALPLISGASDLFENATLAAALVISPSQPSIFGTLAGISTSVKLTTGHLSIALMLALVAAGLTRSAWQIRQRRRAIAR